MGAAAEPQRRPEESPVQHGPPFPRELWPSPRLPGAGLGASGTSGLMRMRWLSWGLGQNRWSLWATQPQLHLQSHQGPRRTTRAVSHVYVTMTQQSLGPRSGGASWGLILPADPHTVAGRSCVLLAGGDTWEVVLGVRLLHSSLGQLQSLSCHCCKSEPG